ncbi:hypothetical protein SCMU_12700 [Sinomonas cyclohexanicum]|uniref:DUF3499 domain-containing protein n=1 Tax=Sinomonas cyclohexanicum TaxID=322009 RepID=A0ABN6FHW6_SINCY|nr:hypothetical protein SCMU_12700 [Corynebacterium cyclohexanicum]
MATLTYVYAESTAVLGPLATYAEPHSYDLCATHADRLTVPRGWEVLRLAIPAAPPRSPDDILALADAVREQEAAGEEHDAGPSAPSSAHRGGSSRGPLEAPPSVEGTVRRHLRLLREPS